MTLATKKQPAEQGDKDLLQQVKTALSTGTVEVDTQGNIVTENAADENPEQTARRSKLSKQRTWYRR